MHDLPVVFLGSNYYTALGGIRTLGRRGVKVYALDYDFSVAYGMVSRYVHERVLCPNINKDEAGLVDFLIKFSNRDRKSTRLNSSHH